MEVFYFKYQTDLGLNHEPIEFGQNFWCRYQQDSVGRIKLVIKVGMIFKCLIISNAIFLTVFLVVEAK